MSNRNAAVFAATLWVCLYNCVTTALALTLLPQQPRCESLAGYTHSDLLLAEWMCLLRFPDIEDIVGASLKHECLEGHQYAEPGCGANILRWLQERANGGDAEAEYAFALTMTESFDETTGCKLGDWTKPLVWFLRAAEQGHAPAQSMLGTIYLHGRPGVSKNEAEAVNWLQKAAQQNDVSAQDELGLAYECGRGVSKSLEQAASLYRLAANQGDARARSRLRGIEHPQDAKSLVRPENLCANEYE